MFLSIRLIFRRSFTAYKEIKILIYLCETCTYVYTKLQKYILKVNFYLTEFSSTRSPT